MVLHRISARSTGILRLVYDFLEVSPLAILKCSLQLSRIPELLPVFVDVLDTLERLFTVFLNVGHVLTSFLFIPRRVHPAASLQVLPWSL